MELLGTTAEAATIVERVAAEERLLTRYDRRAAPLLLEPWEAELLLDLVRTWYQQRRSDTGRPPLSSFGHYLRRWQRLDGVQEDDSGPDRVVRRAGLDPRHDEE
jgi:hypothetical protein